MHLWSWFVLKTYSGVFCRKYQSLSWRKCVHFLWSSLRGEYFSAKTSIWKAGYQYHGPMDARKRNRPFWEEICGSCKKMRKRISCHFLFLIEHYHSLRKWKIRWDTNLQFNWWADKIWSIIGTRIPVLCKELHKSNSIYILLIFFEKQSYLLHFHVRFAKCYQEECSSKF